MGGEGWTFAGEPVATLAEGVTLIEGSSFALSTASGDILPAMPQGLFVRDTRLLSTWQLRLDGRPLEPLGVLPDTAFRATLLSRVPALEGPGDPGVLVERTRQVSGGLREELRLRNPGPRTRRLTLELFLDADLADVFEVKESRVRPRPPRPVRTVGTGLVLGGEQRGVHIVVEGAELITEARGGAPISAEAAPARLRWSIDLAARSDWTCVLAVFPTEDGRPAPIPAQDVAHGRLRDWEGAVPVLDAMDVRLREVLESTRRDLGALRIHDPEHPDEVAVAAGAPWFMALFGRDSLLSSYMALPVDPRLASGTLRTLARRQGRKEDPRTEEQPGRILHETRFGTDADLVLGGGGVYYGSVDATPLFVTVLGELRRWGLGDEALLDLLPHADRALDWCERYAQRDGFLTYARLSPSGLLHQGWKDSVDGITFSSGRVAMPPIALAEVQGYWYAALQARAELARSLGEDGSAWSGQAAALRERFDDVFWLPERGWYATAVQDGREIVDALASNPGHCLWTGIARPDRAEELAKHLLSPEMFTGWGVRTLSSAMGAYDPMSYHNGAVWPHDSALCAAGLMRYGFVDESRTVCMALLDAAVEFGGRLPELFCGFDRAQYGRPVAYPTSCSPQAWASAAPALVLRTLLRFDPDIPAGRCWVAPVLPEQWQSLVLSQVPVCGCRVTLRVTGGDVSIEGLPEDIRLEHAPRPLDLTPAARPGT
jgi:glycogen debranching enzyme